MTDKLVEAIHKEKPNYLPVQIEGFIKQFDGRHGWKLVPVEPDERQVADGVNKAIDQGLDGPDGIGPSELIAIYRAMLAASLDPLRGDDG